VKHSTAESAVAERAVDERLHKRAFNFERSLLIAHRIERLGIADTGKDVLRRQAKRDYASKVGMRKWADCRLRIGQIPLDGLPVHDMRNNRLKRQITASFDQCPIMLGTIRIWNDPLDLGYCKKAL